MEKPILYIVIPCYNEEEVLPITSGEFLAKINSLASKDKISEDSRVLFVNDGSKDRTWEIIKELSKEDEHYIGISQSRNRGHQNAFSGHQSEPEPWPPERRSGRTHGGKGQGGYYDLHRL